MGRILKGIKAGAIAGLSFSLFSSIILYFLLVSMKEDILLLLEQVALPNIPVEEIYNLILFSSPIIFGVASFLFGILVGVIYSYLEGKIPISNPLLKGVTFSLIIWILLSLIPSFPFSPFSFNYLLIIPSILYGITLGFFYSKFK
ncbi:hypothetical protein HRbin06_00150 [archaeon HR06]|nr:hypothetical protein HRbin06_00150 [archaeon HR06]